MGMLPLPRLTPPFVAHSHVIKRDCGPPVQPSTLLSKNLLRSRSVSSLFVPFISSVVVILVRTHKTCSPFLRSSPGPFSDACASKVCM
eukprot:2098143-Rhodomonas_salina.3